MKQIKIFGKGERSQSQRRLGKLQRRGFELQAEKLRGEYNNKYMLGQLRMQAKSSQKMPVSPDKIGNFLKPTKIIAATAHKWAVYDYYSSRYLRGYRARDSHELSVFSKLLVFCAVNTIVEKHAIDTARFETIATEGVMKLHRNGECLLRADDIVSLEDLLHLMIVEEGEVYETMLAVNVGAFLERKRQKEYYSVYDTKDKFMKEHLKLFYGLVNSYCQLLKLENVRYIEADPDLRHEKNRGSAADVAVIAIECLKIPLFMSILKTVSRDITVKYICSQGNLTTRKVTIQNRSVLAKYLPYSNVCRNWEEDNFMSSHCAVYYEDQSSQFRPIVLVLLASYGPSDREKDIQQIVEWYLKNGKQQLESGENEEQSPVAAKKSSVKLAAISSAKKGQPPSKLAEKLQAKLSLVSGKEVPNRYDQAIKFKGASRSIRIKTQL